MSTVAAPVIAALAVYPVKGLRGFEVAEAVVERQGLAQDRRWALVRADGVVLTQRDLPGMARIDAVPQAGGLRLECAGFGGVDARAGGPGVTTVVWRTPVPTTAANDEASAWASRVLGTPCRLVHLADPLARPVTPDLARPGDVVSLADGFPLLVTTQASLAAVNARLEAPVPMDRFRPNLVLENCDAWAEYGWAALETHEVRLRLASPLRAVHGDDAGPAERRRNPPQGAAAHAGVDAPGCGRRHLLRLERGAGAAGRAARGSGGED